MHLRLIHLLLTTAPLLAQAQPHHNIPDDFVQLQTIIPDIHIELRYHGDQNFIGTPIKGYTAHHCWITHQAAQQLAQIQNKLRQHALALKIFDAYRPQQATDHILHWAQNHKNQTNKPQHYPNTPKQNLIPNGYISPRSSHTRGSAVDLTIINLTTNPPQELDMGTPFDYFDPKSHTNHKNLTPQQRANRLLLKTLMQQHGFTNYPKEWWHYTLKNEPHPNTYFNFPTGATPQPKPTKTNQPQTTTTKPPPKPQTQTNQQPQ